ERGDALAAGRLWPHGPDTVEEARRDLSYRAGPVARPPGGVHRGYLVFEPHGTEEARVGIHGRVAGDLARQGLAGGGHVVRHARADERGDLEAVERPPSAARPGLEALDRSRHGLWRDPVQDRAVGDLAGQLQHLGSERGEKDAHRLGRRGRGQPEVLHAVGRALDAHALTRSDQTDDTDRLADLLER